MEAKDSLPMTTSSNPQNTGNITISALVERLGELAGPKLLEGSFSTIRLQGVAGIVRPYGDTQYFDLSHGGYAVEVKCPAEFGANEGEYIVVEGFPRLYPKKNNSGLQIQINGKVVGNWKPRLTRQSRIELNKGKRTKLANFLRQYDVSDIHLIGTKTAINDVLSHAGKYAEQIKCKVIQVASMNELISSLKACYESDMAGYAFVRGGDDPSLFHWDDAELVSLLLKQEKPYYTALGHSHRLTLSDRYADEAFHTPTSMGQAIADILEIKYQQQQAEELITLLRNEKANLEQTVESKHFEFRTLQDQHDSQLKQHEAKFVDKLTKHRRIAFTLGVLLPVVSFAAYNLYI
jgi:exonuclease VII large subunit